MVLYGLGTGSLWFVPGSLWGSAVGLFVWLGFYNFAYSLKAGSVSVNAPIFRLSFVITAVLAILLLGEAVSFGKLLGIGLGVVAVWFLLGAPDQNVAAGTRDSRSSLVRVLIATGAVGIANLLYKFGLRAGATPASLVAMQAFVVVAVGTGFAAIRDRHIWPSAAVVRYAPPAAVMLAAAFVLLTESLARGEASRVVPVAQMGLAVSALLGLLFLGERPSVRKALGLAAALGALAGFAWG